jgi:hypothetical protein
VIIHYRLSILSIYTVNFYLPAPRSFSPCRYFGAVSLSRRPSLNLSGSLAACSGMVRALLRFPGTRTGTLLAAAALETVSR